MKRIGILCILTMVLLSLVGATLGCQPQPGSATGRIAFTANRVVLPPGVVDHNLEIYVMDADGSNQRNLTNNPADDGGPAWSPDGSRIAFTSRWDWNFEIYVRKEGI